MFWTRIVRSTVLHSYEYKYEYVILFRVVVCSYYIRMKVRYGTVLVRYTRVTLLVHQYGTRTACSISVRFAHARAGKSCVKCENSSSALQIRALILESRSYPSFPLKLQSLNLLCRQRDGSPAVFAGSVAAASAPSLFITLKLLAGQNEG